MTRWKRTSPWGSATTSVTTAIAAHMLESLRVKSVHLMTNNPKKIAGLTDNGISVTDRNPAHHPAQQVQPLLPPDQGGEVPGHLLGPTAPRGSRSRSTRPIVEGMSGEQAAVIQDS